MYIQIDEPKERISTKAVKVWRISNTIGHVTAILITAVLILCAEKFDWYGWISIILYIIGGLFIISSIFSVAIEPTYLQRTWRYKIDEQFVQLKHGKWQVEHTIIPMEKVEYVHIEQGPILRRYNLYNIKIGTTTSNHMIPAISSEEAKILRAQIAIYAKIKDIGLDEGEQGA